MNIRLIKLLAAACGILMVVIAAEWQYARYSKKQVLHGFLDRISKKLDGNVIIVRDVFPFSASNNPLSGERMLSWLWHWVHARQLKNPMDIFTFITVLRNMLQVAVSGDSRYGPLNNFGVARAVGRSLIAHGYQIGSGKPITLLGYSGGGQISVGRPVSSIYLSQ